VPLSNTTIYELEQREDFPRRFYLTPRCVVWDSDEVYAWLDVRKQLDQQTKTDEHLCRIFIRAGAALSNYRCSREDQRKQASGGME